MFSKLILIEIRSLFRNKRLTYYIVMDLAVSAFCTLAVLDTAGSKKFLMILWILGGTTFFFISIGFLIFSKDMDYYDCLNVLNISINKYICSKVSILQIGCVLSSTIPVAFFFWLPPFAQWLYCELLVYNLGITTYLVIFISSFSIEKIDL